MAADPIDALRLTLMQDVLPVGMAVVERARKGGPREVLSAFDGSSDDPLGRLRQEGEPAAGQLRDQLDRFSPGLGNPVMKVEVRDVEETDGSETADEDAAESVQDLQETLQRISQRLRLLEARLAGDDGDGEAPAPPA